MLHAAMFKNWNVYDDGAMTLDVESIASSSARTTMCRC
jgi:hypothetical protein